VCPNMKLFTKYKPVKEDTVFATSGNAYKIVGVGTIKIKMSYGVVRTFPDVRYVLYLRRNLISLGNLDPRATILQQKIEF